MLLLWVMIFALDIHRVAVAYRRNKSVLYGSGKFLREDRNVVPRANDSLLYRFLVALGESQVGATPGVSYV